MDRSKVYAWAVVVVTLGLTIGLFVAGADVPSWTAFVFWGSLLVIADLLPVTLGFETRVTMSFPILLAIATLFDPVVTMAMAGMGSIDEREFRRTIPLHRALFNRTQVMLSIALPSFLLGSYKPGFNLGLIVLATAAYLAVNLGLVGAAVHFVSGMTLRQAMSSIPPRPLSGFLLSYLLLAPLGSATAIAYREVGRGGEWVVVAILVPLLFARMTIQGAKAQQELSERIRKQQEALLKATERMFQERERERARIAESIHDYSLQMLAAAAYACSNAQQLLDAGERRRAGEALDSAQEAVQESITALRDALVDLRRSSVEEGGLMETLRKFADQLATLWNASIRIEGTIANEPPTPVALAAFQILQEGLVNALKHSQTNEVDVQVSETDGKVHIVVADRGAGFDPGDHVGDDHMGMKLMHERAAGVGGEINVRSAPGEGTQLEAWLPAGMPA